jgi:hypothetical protein
MSAGAVPSSLEVAAPFLITAGLTALSGLGALLVVARMLTVYGAIFADANLKPNSIIVELRPESLAEISNWAIDGGGLVSSLLGPGIGLALLYDHLGATTILIYSAALLVAFGGFFLFVARVPVRGYPVRPFGISVGRWRVGPRRLGPLTPMVVLAAIANLVVGIAVLVVGP